MKVSPFAGKPPEPGMLVNVPKLVTAYYTDVPDPSIPAQRVAFGTSGHRGSALQKAFNEWHILAITQAICLYRKMQHTDGPLFLGMDTHALSMPAFASSLEVLAANGVEVMIAEGDEYTPTPVISHAILTYNRGRKTGLADGVVITPSHNPPDDGGFKYNPPNGGPAETDVTDWIQATANQFLESALQGIKRMHFEQAASVVVGAHVESVVRRQADLGRRRAVVLRLRVALPGVVREHVHFFVHLAVRPELESLLRALAEVHVREPARQTLTRNEVDHRRRQRPIGRRVQCRVTAALVFGEENLVLDPVVIEGR